MNIPIQGKYVTHCFYWESGTKGPCKRKFNVCAKHSFEHNISTKQTVCFWFVGMLSAKNIGGEQENTTHNNSKYNKLKYSILWFTNFINGEKYRTVAVISISGGESKTEKWLVTVNQWQTELQDPVIWCQE